MNDVKLRMMAALTTMVDTAVLDDALCRESLWAMFDKLTAAGLLDDSTAFQIGHLFAGLVDLARPYREEEPNAVQTN